MTKSTRDGAGTARRTGQMPSDKNERSTVSKRMHKRWSIARNHHGCRGAICFVW